MKSIKVQLFKSLSLAALLIAGASFTACSSSDDNIANEQPVNPATQKAYTLTVKATKGDGDATRALSLNGSTLNATWVAGEKVYVYKGNEIGQYSIGTLEATNVNGTSCTLTGDINPEDLSDLSQGDNLYLQYKGSATSGYANQDGTIATISDYYDRAYAVVTVTGIGNSTVTTSDASFTNQQAIVRFTLQDNAGNTLAPSSVNIQQTVNNVASNITVTGTTYANNGYCFYIPFSQNTSTGFKGDVEITAIVGSSTYIYSKANVTFTAGKYYAITVNMTKMTDNAYTDPQGSIIVDPAVVSWLSAKGFTQADIDALGNNATATEKLYECFLYNCDFTKDGGYVSLDITNKMVNSDNVTLTVQLTRKAPLGAINNGVLYFYGKDDPDADYENSPIPEEAITLNHYPPFDTDPVTGSLTQTITAICNFKYNYYKAVISVPIPNEPEEEM